MNNFDMMSKNIAYQWYNRFRKEDGLQKSKKSPASKRSVGSGMDCKRNLKAVMVRESGIPR